MTLVKWNKPSINYPGFSPFFENFFQDDSDNFFPKSFKTVPAVNVLEEDDKFVIEVAAPGLSKNDFKINLDNDIITIESVTEEKKNEETKNFSRREFSYSSFSRSFTLPDSINTEKINANYANGVLEVDLPLKEESKVKAAREIAIS